MILDYRRDGDVIKMLGTMFSGKITSIGSAGPWEVWHIASGKVFSGQGRPFRRTPSRLFLVKVDGQRACVHEDCKPGAFWAAKRQEFLDKMVDKNGGNPESRAAFGKEG